MEQMVNDTKNEKYVKKRNNTVIVQSPTIVPKSLNKPINDSRMMKLVTVTQNQKKNVVSKSAIKKIVYSKSNVEVSTINDINSSATKTDSSTDVKIVKKVPVLRITISKKYNRPCVSSVNLNKSVIRNTIDASCKTEKMNRVKEVKPDVKNHEQNILVSPSPIIFNLIPVVSEKPVKYRNIVMETKNVFTPKTAYTRKGDLSRYSSRNQTSAERIRYLYTKAQRDCDILKIRLRALRERHKQEEEEKRKLQVHLGGLYKDGINKCNNEVSESYIKKKKSSIVVENTEKEDECEKLLRKVRKIKEDLSKYPITLSNSILNHESSTVERRFHGLIGNNISEMNIMENDEVSDSYTEVDEHFYTESDTNCILANT